MSDGPLFFYGCFHAGLVYSWRWGANDKAGLPAQILQTDRTERNSPMQVQPKHSGFFATILRSAALCFPVVLAACSSANSSSSNPITNPPPVNAQTTYSNAALSGTYSISIVAYVPSSNVLGSDLGTAQLDGNGNITAMSFADYYSGTGGNPCQFTGTGTYSVNSNASGTASVTLSSTNCASSVPPGALTFNLEAAQQGSSFLLTENDGKQLAQVTGLKQ